MELTNLSFNFEEVETVWGPSFKTVVCAVIRDGESTYPEGVMLLGTHIILEVAFWYGGTYFLNFLVEADASISLS